MPSIPFDPSISLASIVNDDTFNAIQKIQDLEAPVKNAEEALNDAIFALRSLNLTYLEVKNLGVSGDKLKKIDDGITAGEEAVATAAGNLIDARIALLNNAEYKAAKVELASKNLDHLESPVDFNKTQTKQMPLSSDSIKMDAQYFSFDRNGEISDSQMAQINTFVSASTSILGSKRSGEATAAVQSQISQQASHHTLDGTLIITATCTHKDALLLAPFVLDVDKAIRIWNDYFKADEEALIKVDDTKSMQKIAEDEGTSNEKKMRIVSGATFGSSFIGMVHVLRAEDTSANQRMIAAASTLQGQMETGGWFASMEGGFGVNAQFSNDVKRLLSSQQIASHVSLVCIGGIPSIKSSEIEIGVKTFADFDPAKMSDKLATLANATTSAQKSVQESAQAARTGKQMVQIRAAEIQSVMSGLGEVDDGKNKMLDINSLMTALEDYLNKILDGKIGAPIEFYLKPITASQLAQMWVAKYLPNEYVTSAGDDSSVSTNGGGVAPTPAPVNTNN